MSNGNFSVNSFTRPQLKSINQRSDSLRSFNTQGRPERLTKVKMEVEQLLINAQRCNNSTDIKRFSLQLSLIDSQQTRGAVDLQLLRIQGYTDPEINNAYQIINTRLRTN